MDRYLLSDASIVERLGSQIKQMRLEQNITQKQLQELSGVSAFSISSVENGGNTSLLTLVQLLRALKRLDMLDTFFVEKQISPIEYAKLQGQRSRRKHASKSTTGKTIKTGEKW